MVKIVLLMVKQELAVGKAGRIQVQMETVAVESAKA